MKHLFLKAKSLTLCLALLLTITACSEDATSAIPSEPSISSSVTQEVETPNGSNTNDDNSSDSSSEQEANTNEPTIAPTEATQPKDESSSSTVEQVTSTFDLSEIPAYNGSPFVAVNDNIPFFNDDEMTTTSFESYSNLDSLGRCGVAVASVGLDIMPTEERESISSVYPTGWEQAQYSNVDGGWLYNRCHILGFQLTGENANEKNLITGTRQMNVDAMLLFENMVADYIHETGNNVYLRVTPIFEGNNLLATGVLMEAKSIEDNGEGVLYNVFCYNSQDGVEIDYATGMSSSTYAVSEETQTPSEPQAEATETHSIADIDTNGNGTVTIAEAKAAGFEMPITSDHWLYQYMKDGDGDGMVGE